MKNVALLFVLALTSTAAVAQSTFLPDSPGANFSGAPVLAAENARPASSVGPAGFPSYVPESAYAPAAYIEPAGPLALERPIGERPRFLSRTNALLLTANVVAQTVALFAIQSHYTGPDGWVQSQGRTFDPIEKHFEWAGYGWGAAYRYGGLVGVSTLVAYIAHRNGHYKLARAAILAAIGHGAASTGYALTGSKGGGSGGW
jgi:hypothetical protein